MTKLATWMAAHNETDDTLAPKLGVSRVHVSRLRRDIHRPRTSLAMKLEEVTGIPAAEFVFGERAA